MSNEKILASKLDIILEKKQGLDATIQAYEKRIDEKLAALPYNKIRSTKIHPDPFETGIHSISHTDDDFLSGVDMSSDDALDQAILNSRPFPETRRQSAHGNDFSEEIIKVNENNIQTTLSPEENQDEQLPTGSKTPDPTPSIPMENENFSHEKPEILISRPNSTLSLTPDEVAPDDPQNPFESLGAVSAATETDTQKPVFTASELPLKIPSPVDSEPPLKAPFQIESEPQPIKEESIKTNLKTSKPKKVPRPKKTSYHKSMEKTAPEKLNLIDMALPLAFFIVGLITIGFFLVLFSQDFSFVDYSVLFILLTCLIFTIAIPYSASMFFMILLLCSYAALSLISFFYINIPFELYQLGWVIVIPLLLWSSALLIRKVREIFAKKRALEGQIASYDKLEESSGLTLEKAYYKDLKSAMDRAVKGESILVLEMISINHLETLKSITGPRLWDEILYKTLKIIKKHCFSTHLIYVLEASVFSIIMENTSMKNQLMINQGINEAFNAMILEYDVIDVHVELTIAAIPFSREITNPFDYRALGLRHLQN